MLRVQLDRSPARRAGSRTIVDSRLKELREDNTGPARKNARDGGRKVAGHAGEKTGRIVQARERSARASAPGTRRDAATGERRRRIAARANECENARRLGRSAARRAPRASADRGAVRAQCEDPRRKRREGRVRDQVARATKTARRSGCRSTRNFRRKIISGWWRRRTRPTCRRQRWRCAISKRSCRKSAKDICAKYINPPKTTDFALMFLPTEGLYAEAIRRVGLVEQVQRDCRVVFAGPTTLAALLNSLQMGFRTLAIQKRSSEVWNLLSTVKNEFGKFGDSLSKVKEKLDQAVERHGESRGALPRHHEKAARRGRIPDESAAALPELLSEPEREEE